ncbi:hypothetical protein BKA59DRAFT_517215 [Fusarium tricinctum]|uniref:Uncharacterized protein n=1 Tax=Fusarium tricinctum TaxID=61284 RepID=A0A8K0W585_9HYPO|nr:hypothetical protein BKA59DRAFT_517215 [Fusarium tricinctum]
MIDLDMEVVVFYDPLPNGRDVGAEEAKRLCYWVDPQGEGFNFLLLDGPEQQDAYSCGPFVLSAIKCLDDDLNLPTRFSQPPKDLLLSSRCRLAR